MTQLVNNLLAQLFDEEGNVKIEQSRNFVKVPEGADDHHVSQSVYLALASLNLPEGFIIDHFYGFNIYTLICEGHINNRIAEVYHEELADTIIQAVVNDDSDMIEMAMKILLEESGLTSSVKGCIAREALRVQIKACDQLLEILAENAENDSYDPMPDMRSFDFNRQVYDTIFNWFIDDLINLHESGGSIESSLLPHAKLILYAKAGYKLDSDALNEMTDQDYLQAIGYCENMNEIDSITKIYVKSKKYPDVNASIPLGFIDEADLK